MKALRIRHLRLSITALLAPIAAEAATLELDRVWGNEAGCAYLKTLVKSDASMLVLSADGLERNPGHCEWAQVGATSDGTQVATGVCRGDAAPDTPRVETYVVERDIADQTLVRILAEDGALVGEVRQCP